MLDLKVKSLTAFIIPSSFFACLLALLTYTTCFRGPPGTTHQNELFRVITVYTHTAMVISFFIGIMVMFMVMVSG